MTRLHEEIETPLPLDVAFPFVADFANSSRWDPGVRSSERIDPGPLGVGARYRLGVRMGGRFAPMEYRISALEPMRRVVLTGSGSGVSAVDEIRFEPIGDGHAHRLHGRHPAGRPAEAGPAVPGRLVPEDREGRARRDGEDAGEMAAREAAGRSRRSTPRRPTPLAGRVIPAAAGPIRFRVRFEQGAMDSMKVAVVGSGISGLTAAYVLNGEHDVRLFEREPAAGGHTATVSIQTDADRSRWTPASSSTTRRRIRCFTRLLAELGVETQPSDMSFSCACRRLRHRVQQPRGAAAGSRGPARSCGPRTGT